MTRYSAYSGEADVTADDWTAYWASYWASQDGVLFFAETTNIADGKLYNQVTGATDYLTVTGAAGSYTFQCPDTAPYIAADTDLIWFKANESQRTPTEAELVGYDFTRTIVKYDNLTPYSIRWIMILSSDLDTDAMRDSFDLSIWWSGVLSLHGNVKGNKPLTQKYEWVTFPVTNLIGYWKLDEATGDYADSSGNGYTGTPSNVTQNATGKIDKAAGIVQASGSYINCGVIADQTIYAVSLWAKRNILTQNGAIFGIGGFAGSLVINTNGDIQLLSKAANQLATWVGVWDDTDNFHHIVFIVSVIGVFGVGSMELYVDGVSQGIKSANLSLEAIEAFVMCRYYSNGTFGTNYSFDGIIDEVGLFSTLSTDDIAYLYNDGDGNTY